MAAKLFVGSLAYTITDEDLKQLFAECGNVVSAKVIIDRDTNQSKGFGFVEMSTEEEAQTAIKQLHGKDAAGRTLVVNIAKPMAERPAGGARPGYNSRPRY
jgi:RNA recognition motif-containing protein